MLRKYIPSKSSMPMNVTRVLQCHDLIATITNLTMMDEPAKPGCRLFLLHLIFLNR